MGEEGPLKAGRLKVGANIGPVVICSLSRWETVRSPIYTAIVFHVRYLGGLD